MCHALVSCRSRVPSTKWSESSSKSWCWHPKNPSQYESWLIKEDFQRSSWWRVHCSTDISTIRWDMRYFLAIWNGHADFEHSERVFMALTALKMNSPFLPQIAISSYSPIAFPRILKEYFGCTSSLPLYRLNSQKHRQKHRQKYLSIDSI